MNVGRSVGPGWNFDTALPYIGYSAVPLGSYLMCLRFLQVNWSFLRTGELPHHDHGHVEGLDQEVLPLAGSEDRIYRMVDDLHPQDAASAPLLPPDPPGDDNGPTDAGAKR